MFLGFFVILPTLASAAHYAGPVDKRCDGAAALATPVTVTSLLPTQTFGRQDGPGSECSITYTTVLPSLGPGSGADLPDVLHPHTYTVAYGCDGTEASPCRLPDSNNICPPGFIRTTTVCDTCGGNSPVTYTLTVVDPTPTAGVYVGYEPARNASRPRPIPHHEPQRCDSEPCSDSTDVAEKIEYQSGQDTAPTRSGDSSGPKPVESVPQINPAGTGEVGGITAGQIPQPTAGEQDSEEHVEVSAGVSVKMLECVQWAGTLLMAAILAAVNIPL